VQTTTSDKKVAEKSLQQTQISRCRL